MKIIQAIRKWIADVVVILVFVGLCYQLILAPNGLFLYFQVRRLRDVQQENLDRIRYEQTLILQKQQLLENDSEYLEREARVVWGYVKPQELLLWYEQGEQDAMEEH